jgi:hypothetical protein
MAVTIHTSPQLYTASDNPITWVFSSNQTGQPNFSYLIELYIDTVLHSRHIIFPEVGARAHFDASEIMSSKVGAVSVQTANISPVVLPTCYIIVRERYGTPPTNQANATSSTINVFKGCLSPQQFEAYNYTNYIGNFMTSFNRSEMYINLTKDFYLMTNINLASNRALSYRRYDSDGVAIGAAVTTAIANTNKFILIDLQFLFVIWSTVGVAYFEVAIIDTTTNLPIGEVLEIKVLRPTDCDTVTDVFWINEFGTFDQYAFTHNKTESREIKDFRYKKQYGNWDGTDFVYKDATSGEIAYKKVIQDKGTIVSGWLNEATQKSISKVYESPYVLVQIGAATYYQIVVENSSYEIKQTKYEELFNEIIEYKLSNSRKSVTL